MALRDEWTNEHMSQIIQLALKPQTYIITILKLEYDWHHKKDWCAAQKKSFKPQSCWPLQGEGFTKVVNSKSRISNFSFQLCFE